MGYILEKIQTGGGGGQKGWEDVHGKVRVEY